MNNETVKIRTANTGDNFNIWMALCKIDQCFICGEKIKLIDPDKCLKEVKTRNRISDQYLFHTFDSHGIQPEVVAGFVLKSFKDWEDAPEAHAMIEEIH